LLAGLFTGETRRDIRIANVRFGLRNEEGRNPQGVGLACAQRTFIVASDVKNHAV